ncbi:hypothetical protein QQZ08_004501 [Neonectria magnoliae]|uniref:Methyltransferase n=1 Tax=Neonectria magnoliae TaxID=2732573 RepID=A0ABR1I7J3_9HYPO
MLPPAQPSTLSVAHSISRKRSHSDALGREDTGTHCDRGTLHSTEQIWNDMCGILDNTAKKNKPDRILDDSIGDDNTFHGDIATNPTTADITGDRSTTDNDPINEGPMDEGSWAMDFADEHPGLEVISIDLVPLAPEFVPPNLDFGILESLGLGTFEKSSLDFIHLRDLKGRISNWGEFAKEIFDVLKPGGVAEFHEGTIDFKVETGLPETSCMQRWIDLFREAGKKRGARFDVVESQILLDSLRGAGFIDIMEYPYKVPIEPWEQQGKLGWLAWKELDLDIEGSILRPTVESLEWSQQRYYMFAARLREELKKTKVKPYMTRLAVVCKKPLTDSLY